MTYPDVTVTHPDFKSIDPKVDSVEIMEDYLGYALSYQSMFDRRTTPWEKSQWDDDELNELEVDLEKIDRLYYIYHFEDGVSGQDFLMAARMKYKGRNIFVELSASCDFTGFDCQGQGVLFVSGDANLFMKLVMTSKYQQDLIKRSLAEDGIFIEGQNEYDTCQRTLWKNTPMLKYLCHQTVYDNQAKLKNYSAVLPKILTESIDDFVKTKDARRCYDDCE